MPTTIDHQILDDLLDPVGQCLTTAVAARIVALRADPKLQRRLDKLAQKNAEGRLTPRETAEYTAYVEALDVVGILQAMARKTLRIAGRSK